MRLVMPLQLQSQISSPRASFPRLAINPSWVKMMTQRGRHGAAEIQRLQGFARALLHANKGKCQLAPEAAGAGCEACVAGFATGAGGGCTACAAGFAVSPAADAGAEALAAWTYALIAFVTFCFCSGGQSGR